ncbi:MoxR family ATPase [Lentzea sp. BCCO 10_0061]|uniref:MoxR family ATPase n=1 Tax=Lentzea sokolovensis TaxID=3095429 RepID=A0ABU4V816_9PSEU|nr:MoxR family ATPase [Lentzea sp. BCCO 10_0061]MDX8147824.1 MoxR family ATPase [Lentzea sp. BCCO 10_0061]
MSTLDSETFDRHFANLSANISDFIRGKPEVVRLALVCLFAQGHLLIEDVPGVAKTSLAKALAKSVSGATVKRIQFTPDLLPSDVVGVQTYDQSAHTFEFFEGPVFANIVIGDEINRASPKTQSALLEVMAERQVTVDGRPRPVPAPFLCIATQNPIEHHGTYALPEAQLDRFMMRIKVGYPPGVDDEVDIIADGVARRAPEELGSVMTLDDLRDMIELVRSVHIEREVQRYVAVITRETRKHASVRLGISPRGSIAVAAAAQAHAAVLGRSFVTPEDVRVVAKPVLNHRLLLTPEARVRKQTAEDVLDEILVSAPVPRPSKWG